MVCQNETSAPKLKHHVALTPSTYNAIVHFGRRWDVRLNREGFEAGDLISYHREFDVGCSKAVDMLILGVNQLRQSPVVGWRWRFLRSLLPDVVVLTLSAPGDFVASLLDHEV